MKSKKRIIKLGVVLILLIVGFISFPTIKKYSSNINLLAFFDNTTYEERPLSEVVNKMYVTLLDEKAKVVASTNPETEVDTKYKYTDTQKPQKQVTTSDNLNLLFEMVDTNDENGYTKIEEDVVYTLDLPELIIPEASYDEGVTIGNKCYNFSKKGKTTACGGIYQENGKYTFKVKFKNTLNKKDVKASYQSSIKLNPSIEDIVFNIKTIDFALPGSIQLYMEKEETPIIENPNYNIKVENNGYTSDTHKYIKWTTTITDLKEEKSTKGSLIIQLSDYLGFHTDQYNWYFNLVIYADGNRLYTRRNGNYTNLYYDSNIMVNVSMNEQIPLNNTNNYSYFLKSLKLDFSDSSSGIISNVKEFKIEIITSDYSIPKTDYIIFEQSSLYTDEIDNQKTYSASSSFKKEYKKQDITYEYTLGQYSDAKIPDSITFTANIKNNDSSYISIEEIPDVYNTMGLYYYLPSEVFNQKNGYLSDYFKVYIDGYQKYFSYIGNNSIFNYLYAINGNGSSDHGDTAVYKQLMETNSDLDQKYMVYRALSNNTDGDYCWLVIEKETFDRAIVDLNGGTEYRYTTSESKKSILHYPARWKIYLYNVSGQEIKIEYTKKMGRMFTYFNDSSSKLGIIRNQINISDGVHSISKTVDYNSASNYSGGIYSPLRINGNILNDNFIKWDIDINMDSIYRSNISYSSGGIIITVPMNQSITNTVIEDNKNSIRYYAGSEDNVVTSSYISGPKYSLNDAVYYCDGANVFSSNSYSNITECNNYNKLPGSWKEITRDYLFYYISNGSDNIPIRDLDIDWYNNKVYLYTIPNNISAARYSNSLKMSFFTHIDSFSNPINNDYYLENIGVYLYALGQNGGVPEIQYIVNKTGETVYPTIDMKLLDQNDKYNQKHCIWRIAGNIRYPKSYVNVEKAINSFMNNDYLLFHGAINLSNKFNANTEEERIIARNTKLQTFHFMEANGPGTSFQLYSTYIDDNSFCRSSFYGGNVKMCYKINTTQGCNNNSQSDECKNNMLNGFTWTVSRLHSISSFDIIYETVTDLEAIQQELRKIGKKLDINLVNKVIMQMNDFSSEKGALIKTKDYTFELLADLSIEKNVNQGNDENYQNDTKHQEVVATIGYTDSEYLDITDFIDGVSNLKYNTSTKKYDKTDLSTDMNKLKEIRKYVDISNLKISIQKHYNGTYETIYSNGSFTSDYQGSTLTYINNTNELYKLHLVKSSGNIPALTDVKVEYDMTFNLEKENNYRLKDIYKGGKYYISTNVEGIRSYEDSTMIDPSGVSYKNKVTIPKKLSSQDGNYENKIDTTNKTLTAYASNTGASIGADYLEPPTIKKEETSYLNKNGQSSWRITYNVNSTGKSEKATLNVNDTMKFNITGNSTYNEPIKQILQDKVKYKNIKIYLNDLQSLIYEYPNTLKSNQTISVNGITGTLSSGNSSYSLVLNNLDYGDIIYITYDLDLDFESAYHEMIENNYIDSNYKLKDTNELLNITYTNGVGSPNYEESFVEKSGSRVSVADFMPTIHKKSNGTANDETSWEMNFNTGTNSSPIKVVDEIEVSSDEEGLKDIIEGSLIFKDLQIIIGDTIVYENEEFNDNWNESITIKKNPFGYEFNIKDTDNNSFIKDNLKVVIKYKTSLDDSKYKGSKKNGVFSLKNHVDITKNDFTSSDEVLVNGINYDFPMTVDKEFLNISEDLLETNWKITINTGRMNRKNLKISDIATLGSDFGKYLSMKEFRILLNGEEIENDIILNQDNTYNFDITLPEVDKYSTIEIFYTLKVNKEEYILHNEPLDNELLINNKVEVTTDDGTDIEDTDRASSKVLSELTKRFDFLGYDDEGYPIIRWYIDVNLESEYDVSTLEGKEVIITDNLSDILELIDNSITVKTRSVTSNGVSTGSNISTEKYILNTEDNKVQVSLLDPVNTSNLRISFETKCFASISEVENYVTLSVDGEEKELKSSRNIRIFSPVVSGYISSREVTNYNIKGYKYLDDKLSKDSFIFEVVEVNEDGTIKENGFTTRNTNSEEGEITFNSLTYDREGFYYYKIKEVMEDNEDIIYDDTEYLLRIKVSESHGEYIIEDVKLLNTDKEEITFYNKTKKEEEEKPNIIDVIVNPYTGRSLLLLLCILIPIIGIFYIRKRSKV